MTIDAPCLDCGEPLQVSVRDGKVTSAQPETLHAYVDIPFARWRPNMAYS